MSDSFVLTVVDVPEPPPPPPPSSPLPAPPSSVAPTRPTLTIADARRVEGNAGTANLVFTVRLSAGSGSPVGVAFATQDLPASNPRRARAGPDYLPRRGTLTIPAGRTVGTVAVPIRGDVAVEPDESFRPVLSNATNATLARTSALATILDNGGPPKLFIDDAERAEGQAGRAPLAFTVGLTRPSRAPVTVSFATVNGTARAPGDFVAGRGTLTFAPGVVRRTILVPVVGDRAVEPHEQVRVVLSRASVGLADPVGIGTILNDD